MGSHFSHVDLSFSLEYKYMKLVEGKGGTGELPAAETCGLDDEDEEDDIDSDLKQFDSVEFKQKGKMNNLFGKLKSSLGKRVSSSDSFPLP